MISLNRIQREIIVEFSKRSYNVFPTIIGDDISLAPKMFARTDWRTLFSFVHLEMVQVCEFSQLKNAIFFMPFMRHLVSFK